MMKDLENKSLGEKSLKQVASKKEVYHSLKTGWLKLDDGSQSALDSKFSGTKSEWVKKYNESLVDHLIKSGFLGKK